MIRALGLASGYGPRPVVRDVNLAVRPGEFVAVIGPNASGKTTLLKTLASLLRPLGGVVYLDGRPLTELKQREIARRVGVVLTESVKPGRLTVFELVALGRYPYTGPLGRLSENDRGEVMRALRDVGVEHLCNEVFSKLSDGQRQKVMIARALAQDPRVLILDEPVTFLDPKARVDILLSLRRICRERHIAVLASLHEIELALRLADRLLVVHDGFVDSFDSPEEFVAKDGPEALYGLEGDATFSAVHMAMELRHHRSRQPVFVIAGAGTGALVYRMLSRLGYPIITGVLHRGDIDYSVASLLRARVVSEEPFRPVSREAFEEAQEAAGESFAAIYTSPPLGPMNSANQILAKLLASCGVPLIVYGGGAVDGAWRRASTLSEVASALEELEQHRPRSGPRQVKPSCQSTAQLNTWAGPLAPRDT